MKQDELKTIIEFKISLGITSLSITDRNNKEINIYIVIDNGVYKYINLEAEGNYSTVSKSIEELFIPIKFPVELV